MRKAEYDFLSWTSFPSSGKILNDTRNLWAYFFDGYTPSLAVTPGSTIMIKVNAKQSNVMFMRSGVVIHWYDREADKWRYLKELKLPLGSFDWQVFEYTFKVPAGVTLIRGRIRAGGSGTPGSPGITWFDDLKIYQDDKLIYDNYFTALRPGKVVPVIWTPPERIIGAYQRWKQGEKALIFKPPRLLQTVKV